MSFFEELKRRNVVKVGVAYLVAAWLLLQLTEVLTELLELDTQIGKMVILLLIIGFIPALIFAWAFEMTPEGIKRDKDVDRSQSVAKQTGQKLNIAVIVMLAMIAGYFIWESRFKAQDTAPQETAVIEALDEVTPEPGETFVSETTIDTNAIAVLPFANRSLREEDLFFTDGIHDDLLTQLAKISGLKVVSRTSVAQYRGTAKTIAQIAEELQVGTILEGGIQRAGNRVRINAQLIDVTSDQHLWAETFDAEMTVENIFDIQTEITQQITQAVRGELTDEERATLARIPTNNLEAYEAYLKAMALMHQADYEQENFQAAERWATRAVMLDPGFAEAWAILVEVNAQAVWIGYDATPEREEAALEALENVRRLATGTAETIAAEAEYAYRIQHNFPAAALLFQRAAELLPGDLDLLFRLGVAQRRTADLAGAEETLRRAMAIDPNNARPVTVLVEMLVNSSQLEKAQSVLRPALSRFPDVVDLKAMEINLALAQGQADLARALLEKLPELNTNQVVVATAITPLQLANFDQAISAWDQPHVLAYESNRGFIGIREATKAWAYALKGEHESARSEARACVQRLSDLPEVPDQIRGFELAALSHCYLFLDEPALAMRAANEAQAMIPESKDSYFGALIARDRALSLAMAGQRDAALTELERMLGSVYPPSKLEMQIDARWDFFRDDPRFNALIATDGAPGP